VDDGPIERPSIDPSLVGGSLLDGAPTDRPVPGGSASGAPRALQPPPPALGSWEIGGDDGEASLAGRGGLARGGSALGDDDSSADGSGLHVMPEHAEGMRSGTRSSDMPPPPEGALDARVDRLFDAERHFRRGNRALDRGSHDEALVAFAKAHEICPEQGEFLAYVGWARHCLAPDDAAATESALRELARARELAPDLHVTHLLAARVLGTAGRAAEARDAYLRVLELDPGCIEAREAIAH
jgi:tetratricopeptide (TPR) repeat protein